jgi:hypothetical protein
VVLNGEGVEIEAAQAFHNLVVKAVVTHFDSSKAGRRLEYSVDWCVNGESMVLAGDFDTTGGLIQHRLVNSTVTEGEFVGREPQSTP